MIDNNELELEVMRLFKEGKHDEAEKLQDEFLEKVKNTVNDHCPCPEPCKHHGKCIDCVIIHRGHGDHLPYCMQEMLNRKLESLSELSEHSFKPPKRTY